MPRQGKRQAALKAIPLLKYEPLYLGIDVGKARHVAGFVSTTLLERHERFEGCPALSFENSRAGFRALVERVQSYAAQDALFRLARADGTLSPTVA